MDATKIIYFSIHIYRWKKITAPIGLEPRGRVIHASTVVGDQLVFWGSLHNSATEVLLGIGKNHI
jgi:hypothetical protein